MSRFRFTLHAAENVTYERLGVVSNRADVGGGMRGPGNLIEIFAVSLYLYNRQTGVPDTKNNNHGFTPNDGGNVHGVLLVPC